MSAIDIVLKIGSLSGLVAFSYLVADNLRRRSRLKWIHEGRPGNTFVRDNLTFYVWTFEGQLRNLSPEVSSVARIFLVAWQDRAKNRVFRYGWGGVSVTDRNTSLPLPVPFTIGPKETKSLSIQCEFPLSGTHEARLVGAVLQDDGRARFVTPAVEYQLCFEDVNENLFDQDGHLCDRKQIDLQWLRANPERALATGHWLPVVRHDIKILRARLRFTLHLWSRRIGLLR